MKNKRQTKILELVADQAVETQEDLLRLLQESGFQATQATVSRDIKELRLIKVLSGGRYRYTAGAREDPEGISKKFRAIFAQAVRQVDWAGNMVVVKCYTGMANAACAALDSVHWDGVVGTLAGDDTIFIVARDDGRAEELAEKLRSLADAPREE